MNEQERINIDGLFNDLSKELLKENNLIVKRRIVRNIFEISTILSSLEQSLDISQLSNKYEFNSWFKLRRLR